MSQNYADSFRQKYKNCKIYKDVFISKNVELDNFDTIFPGVFIHNNVKIGKNVTVHPNVVIFPGAKIGDNVQLFSGCVIGKMPTSAGATSRKVKSVQKPVSIGNGCVVSPNVVVYSDVKIGKNTLLGDNASIREGCRVGNKCLISRNVSINYNTIIGNDTKVMDNTHLTGNMVIGDNVFVSCLVATTNDNYIGKKGFHEKMKGPVIEDNASIGAGANLLPNVRIGNDAIVAAGAVVTKDVPSNTVVMGVPARMKAKR